MSVDRDTPRFSPKERLIFELLLAGREMYGLELVARSGGELSRGSVYVLLGRMEKKGLVVSRQEAKRPGASGIPRRLYRPTGYGERVYRLWERLRELRQHAPAPRFA